MSLHFHPLTKDRWGDLEALFGTRGACGGCWCMFPRLSRPEFERGKGDANRRALQRLVTSGPPPGILAYDGEAPVGWCALAPREAYPLLARSRLLQPLDARPTWSITCLFVARGHRKRGLSVALLDAAARHARACGATLIEGYPSEPRTPTADTFVWHGTVSAFRRAGFVPAARPSPTRAIMRRELGPSARAPRASRTRSAGPGKESRRSGRAAARSQRGRGAGGS